MRRIAGLDDDRGQHQRVIPREERVLRVPSLVAMIRASRSAPNREAQACFTPKRRNS